MSTGSGGCCSLECGAKTVAWVQTVLIGLVTLFYGIGLIIELGATEITPSHVPRNATNADLATLAEEETSTIVTFALFGIFIFLLIEFVLALFLLYGIYKTRMNYVATWLVVKGILIALALITLLFRFTLLFFGIDSDLTRSILYIVIQMLQTLLIFLFWQEKKSEFVPVN